MSSKSLQSYSPTVRRLDYDSLAQRLGCEVENDGNQFYAALPFVILCVLKHSSTIWFNTPDTVSYAIGPQEEGNPIPKPFMTGWVAWVGPTGILVGKSATTGTLDLYPTTRPKKIALGFDEAGYQHLAIEKLVAGDFIEIKYHIAGTANPVSISFSGRQPLFFNHGTLASGGLGQADLVVYYLKATSPNTLYARFKQEPLGGPFSEEHVVMPDLRVRLSRLLGSRGLAGRQVIYAQDDLGRDVTLTSEIYPFIVTDKAGIDTSFYKGVIYEAIVAPDTVEEEATITTSFKSGSVILGVVSSEDIDEEKCSIVAGFDSGDVVPA